MPDRVALPLITMVIILFVACGHMGRSGDAGDAAQAQPQAGTLLPVALAGDKVRPVLPRTTGPANPCSGMATGRGASLNGFRPFPSDDLWNREVSAAPVDPNSAAIMNFIGPGKGIHPDFGSGLYEGRTIGIPYVVVDAGQGMAGIKLNAYGEESDPGPMPIPADAPIEGYPKPAEDRHVVVVDKNDCWLYELYGASQGKGGTWTADSAAVWDLLASPQRPYGWTSADAAGLPIFPGMVRFDEVASGQIKHALRFSVERSRAAFVPPASHWAANNRNPVAPPMGMRVRLKASYDISSFSATNQVILKAMKQYGMIMADNGGSIFISGAPDDRWDNSDLHELGRVKATDFEVIRMDPVYEEVPRGKAPSIASLSSKPVKARANSEVTLSWDVTGATYLQISPDVGPVRGKAVNVRPATTTTYTLYATNRFGRSTATVKVTVE